MSSRPPKSKSRKSGDSAAKLARLSEPLQECANILKFFQSRPDADAFTEPVDWEAFGLLDYPEVRTKGEQKRETRSNNERICDACSARMLIAAALVSLCVSASLLRSPQIITHPMDLGTVQTKLEDGKYSSPADFSKDMRLVWKNAMTYNRPDSDIFETAEKLAKLFEKKIAKIKSNKKRAEGGAGAAAGGAADDRDGSREVTRAERLKFASLVSGLSSEQLGQLVQLIQKECPEAINDDDEEELEIEINNLDGHTLAQLNTFCQRAVEEKQATADIKKEGGASAQKRK
jgi:hypothetical protein